MEDTLLIGDRILVRVFPRVTPGRGDIIAFRYPIDRRQTFIKRAIGVPGDRVRMVSKVVFVNGVELKEPYAVHKIPERDEYRDNLPHDLAEVERFGLGPGVTAAAREMMVNHVVNGEVVVPAGKYFVLGDNRDNSLDSRFWGFVDAGDLVGKPVIIYASEETVLDAPKIGWPKVRWGRVGRVL